MNEPKDITPLNKNGQEHGYWEEYHYNGNLLYKGNYINGEEDGYWVWYNFDGGIMDKEYYIR